MSRKALGKGINALIPDFEKGVPVTATSQGVMELLITEISPNKHQPRKHFDTEKLEDLVQSIKENGVIQPVVVQRVDDVYELIVGERRWRASQKAGLKKIPAIVREATSSESLQLAIIENIHRQDLNPIEEAEAYSELSKEFGLNQEDISRKVGKNRASISNYLRLLKLPRTVQTDLIAGRLDMGHARALLGLESEKDLLSLSKQVVKRDLTVRQVEALVQKINTGGTKSAAGKKAKKNIFVKDLEKDFERCLGTKVKITESKRGGKMAISYYSNDDLNRICDIIFPKNFKRL